MEVALPALLRRFPTLKLASDDVAWGNNITLRGQPSMPIHIGS